MSENNTDNPQEGIKIFVGNIPLEETEDSIRKVFSPYGGISSVFMMTDKKTKAFNGCVFINYTRREDGEEAVKALHRTAPFDNVYCFLKIFFSYIILIIVI